MTEKEMRENTTAEFRIFVIVTAIVAVVCLVGFLIPKIIAWNTFQPIDADQVESISCSNCVYHYELDASEQAKFIELYNGSDYYGREIEWGTTPGTTYYITFGDGSRMEVTQYGHLWIIDPNPEKLGDFYYVENQGLRDFDNQLYLEKIRPSQ